MNRKYIVIVFILLGGIIYFMPPLLSLKNTQRNTQPSKNLNTATIHKKQTHATNVLYPATRPLPHEKKINPIKFYDKDTLPLLMKLQSMFKKNSTVESHLEMVKEYLYKKYSIDKANAIFDLYKKFLSMQMDLMDIISTWPMPKTTEDILEQLDFVQNFRIQRLGKDIADLLYGDEIKKKKFLINRESIIYRNDLYSSEKEELLEELKAQYGDVVDHIDISDDFLIYREQLALYKKDLEDLDNNEKKQKIREIREKLFSRDVVQRLEQVDKQMEEFNKAMETYNEQKKKILSDNSITKEEKEVLLDNIRKELFGKDAEGIKRIENMEMAKKQLIKRDK